MDFKIPLRNIDKEIVAYTIVSECDFEILNKLKWNKNPNGYAKSTSGLIHRFIYKEIMKIKLTTKNIVDHINNNRLDNRRENLRIVTHSENVRNKSIRENITSNYNGVHLNKEKITNKWISNIKINKNVLRAAYEKEEHAAHQYNLWCIEYNLTTAKLNILSDESIVNFEPYVLQVKNGNNLPKGITMISENKYRLFIYRNATKEHIGYFKTEEEANKIRLEKLKEYENLVLKNHYENTIKRNKDNQCIIELFDKNKNKTGESIVDEDIYYELTKYTWRLSNNYVINDICGRLHRHILNYTGEDVVDHINSNPLDNRRFNLRIVTQQQNIMNKSAKKNGSSKYIGIRFREKINKWEANIYVNNKQMYLGIFETEIEAAKARDTASKKYFGEYGKLNFIN
jgi:hypothetical protein